jgi:hypothetical protein
MTEIYAYLTVFAVRVLALALLYPTWFISYLQTDAMLDDRTAERYPDLDFRSMRDQFVARFRVLNICIALVGIALLSWLISYMQNPDSYDSRVKILVEIHFFALMVPLAYAIWIKIRHKRLLRRTHPVKRRAVLQRRGFFDFVSRFAVVLAVVSYFLCSALVIYINQDPFPGFAGYYNIAIITVFYALLAFGVYRRLYGKKNHPLETHEERAYTTGVIVRTCVNIGTFLSAYVSLILAIQHFDLASWAPVANSLLVTAAIVVPMALAMERHARRIADNKGRNPSTSVVLP